MQFAYRLQATPLSDRLERGEPGSRGRDRIEEQGGGMTHDDTATKPLIFISHIHEHGKLSSVLTDEIAGLLLGGVDFFVSSDRVSITGGDKWLDKVETALKNAAIVMVICTKESVHRPWVNFEAGGAWMIKKRVVPLCFGGFQPSDLPQPLASRQAYDGADSGDLVDLVKLIAREAGLNAPDFAADTLVEKLVQALSAPEESIEAPAEPALESKPERIQVMLKLKVHYFINDTYEYDNRDNARRRVEEERDEIIAQLSALLARRFGPRFVRQEYRYEIEFPSGKISTGSDEDLQVLPDESTAWGTVEIGIGGNELALLNEIRNHQSIRNFKCTSISFDFPGKIDMEAFAEELFERKIDIQSLRGNFSEKGKEIALGTLADVNAKTSIRISKGNVSIELSDYDFKELSLSKTVAPIFAYLRLAEHITNP